MLAKALAVVLVACYAFSTATALSAGAARRHRLATVAQTAVVDAEAEGEAVDVPDSMPVDVFAHLEKRGAWTITALSIHRTPIQSFIPKVLNFLSGGKWRDALDAAGGYDKMFHLAIVTTVQSPDGKETEYWKVEKSPNVEMTKVTAAALDAHSADAVKARLEVHPFAVAPGTKLHDLFRDAKTTKGFWLYDAFNRPPYDKNGGNCQDFVRRILTTISPGGHLPQATTEWVFQDGVTIGEHLGWFSRAVAKGLTNTGAMVDIVKDTVAHPMVKARQLKSGGSFVEADADAEFDAELEGEDEGEDEDEAEDEAEDELADEEADEDEVEDEEEEVEAEF